MIFTNNLWKLCWATYPQRNAMEGSNPLANGPDLGRTWGWYGWCGTECANTLGQASKKPGKAKNVSSLKAKLKLLAKPVRVNQYPIRLEAYKGLESLINTFLKYGLLKECQSEFNTPTLPAKKPHFQDYRLVQDLRVIKLIWTYTLWHQALGLTSMELIRRISFLNLLFMLFLMQPRVWLAFWTVGTDR